MISIDTGTEELICKIENRVATVTLNKPHKKNALGDVLTCLLYTSPSPRDVEESRMPSSA